MRHIQKRLSHTIEAVVPRISNPLIVLQIWVPGGPERFRRLMCLDGSPSHGQGERKLLYRLCALSCYATHRGKANVHGNTWHSSLLSLVNYSSPPNGETARLAPYS